MSDNQEQNVRYTLKVRLTGREAAREEGWQLLRYSWFNFNQKQEEIEAPFECREGDQFDVTVIDGEFGILQPVLKIDFKPFSDPTRRKSPLDDDSTQQLKNGIAGEYDEANGHWVFAKPHDQLFEIVYKGNEYMFSVEVEAKDSADKWRCDPQMNVDPPIGDKLGSDHRAKG